MSLCRWRRRCRQRAQILLPAWSCFSSAQRGCKMSESSTRSGEWLTVSQAAAALGISERAIQKRCASGKLAARRVETAQGTRWEIDANQITRTGTRTGEPNARTLDANQRTKSPESPELTHEIGREPTNQQDANHANAQADFHAHLVEENRFLRGLVEQRDRDAAELRAALRTALAAMPKALPGGDESSTRNDAETSRENAPQAAIISATGKQSQDAEKAVKREMRPLWKVILGVR